MAVKPDINAVWQDSWGVKPEADGVLSVDMDTSKAPALWPDDTDRDGLLLAPLLNNGQWLTLLKIQNPGAINELQNQALQAIGFRVGNAGRLIHPRYPTPHLVDMMAKILKLPLDTLRGDQVVTLAPSDRFEPAVPLEVQAGVRHYWKKRPDVLAEEIMVSLKGQEDDLSLEMLKLIEKADNDGGAVSPSLKNPLRLQVWVSQALSGEINPITESILSLGLQRGTMGYGPVVTDWPEDCQNLFAKLADFRGDAPAVEESLIPPANQISDGRPALRTQITWVEDNSRFKGVIVGLPEDQSEVWVTPLARASDDATNPLPFYVPTRRRVPVSAIVEPALPEQSTQRSDQPGGLFAGVTDSVELTPDQMEQALFGEDATEADAGSDLMSDQPPVTLAELPNRFLAQREAKGILREKLQDEIRLLVASGNLMGQHPMALPPGETDVDLVVSWREIGNQLDAYHDSSQARLDAEVITRDALLETFNRAQPMTMNGERSALAVLPAGHYLRGVDASDPAMAELASRFEFCRVGFHPLLLPELTDRLTEWKNEHAGDLLKIDSELSSMTQADALFINSQSMTLNQCGFFGLSDNAVRSISQSVYRDYYVAAKEELGPEATEYKIVVKALEGLASEEGRNAVQKATDGNLFGSYREAAQFIAGTSPRIKGMAQRNRDMFQAIATLTETPVETVIATPQHPLMVILDVIERHGTPAHDRAELLALMNIDLTERMNWVGQLAAIHGASVDMAYTTSLAEHPTDEDAEKLQGLGLSAHNISRGLPRMTATTGLLRVGHQRRPFQFALLAETDNLFKAKVNGVKIQSSNPLMVVDSDRKFSGDRRNLESLGQLVDLHRIAPLQLGEPLTQKGQVIRTEAIDALKPTVYGMSHLSRLNDKASSSRVGIGALEEIRPVTELMTEMGYTSGADISAHIQENRQILLTGSPAWREREGLRKDLEEAFTLFQHDIKPLQSLSRPERFTDNMISELSGNPDAEILVIAVKSTRSSVRWFTQVVTKQDLLEADNDRELAAEYGILQCKAHKPTTRKGHHFAVFDIAQSLRPEAMRYLNELRDEHRRKNRTQQEVETPKTRGARQDQGLVAGLAIKDLRGKSSVVLNTLSDATPSDQKKFIVKTKLWEAPDWAFLRAPSEEDRNEGARPMEPVVAAFFDEMRKRLNPGPPANIADFNQVYARFVLGIRDIFDEVRTEAELKQSLKSGGKLNKLQAKLEESASNLGVSLALIVGDDVAPSHWHSSEGYAFVAAYMKAEHRTRKNLQWDIKEAKPGTGRRPRIDINSQIEADGDNEEEQELTGAMPMLSRLVRTGGEDYRGGLDVSEATVIKTFGFSGIEYGKSMSQTDRTTYLNEAYDGFMDLSKLLDVPPQALSLGGTLGLAFGSRGRGGRRAALAHFEPANNAINLTRMKGAGSMAHEYGHAFANYLFRVSRGLEGSRAPGDITAVMAKQITKGQAVLAGNLRQPVADAVAAVLMNIKYKPFEEGEAKKETKFVAGAKYADYVDGRSYKNPYWPTIEELFARAFETYVHTALKDKYPDFKNDFLVREDKLAAWGSAPYVAMEAAEAVLKDISSGELEKKELGENPSPEKLKEYREKQPRRAMEMRRISRQPMLYPAGEELSRIKKAFNHLFETLETKEKTVRHDYLGEIDMPVLYSAGSGITERITVQDHAVIAECVLDEVARMCGRDVWVNWQQTMTDPEGNVVAGRYFNAPDVFGKLHSVIDLAYGAGIHTAHHEAFHFAQDHLLEKSEQAMLDRFFAAGSPLIDRLRDSLLEDGRHDTIAIIERDPMEAQAYAYEQWVKGRLDVKIEEPPVGVFGRVSNFFTRVAGISQNAGFKTPEQLFQAFYQGHLRDRRDQRQRVSDLADELFIEEDGPSTKKRSAQGSHSAESLEFDEIQLIDEVDDLDMEYVRPGY